MRFEFIAEDGRWLGSCAFPGFAGGELVDATSTDNGWALSLRRPNAKPASASDWWPSECDVDPDEQHASPLGTDGGRRVGDW